MAERLVREVTRDDTHLADAKSSPGAHRGLEYDDDNNLVAHAEYYQVDEEELYEQLKEKYDRSSDDDYEYEADVDELQKKFEFGAAIAGAAVVLAPYMMDWMRETALPWMRESALPRVKTTVRRLRDKIGGKRKISETDFVPVALDVSERNGLAFAKQIATAEKEYRKQMTSDEARRKLIRIVALAMALTKEINELSNADVRDEQALAAKENWRMVENELSKSRLLEGVNNILATDHGVLPEEQIAFLKQAFGRELYQGGIYVPIEPSELRAYLDDGSLEDSHTEDSE